MEWLVYATMTVRHDLERKAHKNHCYTLSYLLMYVDKTVVENFEKVFIALSDDWQALMAVSFILILDFFPLTALTFLIF